MSIHVCKQCGSRFEYCRACVFRPIRYKDKGFCSKECYEASKKAVEPETIEEPIFTEEVDPVDEVLTEVEAEAEVSEEISVIETTTQIIENETDDINEYLVRE